MEKVVVTGGAGFIGSHLCEALSKDKALEVTSIDNYSTGTKMNHVAGVKYLSGETADIEDLIDFRPSTIYHLGEYSRVEESFNESEKVFQYNKIGTYKVVKFCSDNGCKLIYAASSTKFGDGGLGRSQSPYGWSKASNVELIENYANWFGLEFAVTYFYNAYGPREISSGRYATLIAIFSERMRMGLPLTVVQPGTQRRNFTHVSDIVSGLVRVGEDGRGDGFGIGNPAAYSVMEVAKMFGGEVELVPERRGNRSDADLVTEKIIQLGWSPKIDLRDYIEEMRELGWCRSQG